MYLGSRGTSGSSSCRDVAARVAESTMAVLLGLEESLVPALRGQFCFSIHCQHFGKWKLQLSVVEYVQYAVLLSMGDTHVCASKYAEPWIIQQLHI